ncbi:MAG: hypothetical protein DRH90_25220 [Deltaproteobacteria bacterium]|nr:MAG: hypothetical protein DRH90_25220 [Deltaproteobacteria bacterium]
MSEEAGNATTVTEAELKKVEEEVAKKTSEEAKKLSDDKAKEIEDRIRKEFEAKEKDKALQDRLAKIEKDSADAKVEADEKIKKQEELLKNQEEVFKQKLEEAMAVKKGITRSDSPFDVDKSDKENVKTIDGKQVDVSKLDYDEIEKLSAERFRKEFNLPSYYFDEKK